MRMKKFLNIIESIYSVILLLVVGLYILCLEFESSVGTPPSWLYTAVGIVLLPGAFLLIKEGISFLSHLLKAGDPDA